MDLDAQVAFADAVRALFEGVPNNEGKEPEIIALMDKHLGGRIKAAGLIDDLWPFLGIVNDYESLRTRAHVEEMEAQQVEWQAEVAARKGEVDPLEDAFRTGWQRGRTYARDQDGDAEDDEWSAMELDGHVLEWKAGEQGD